MPVGDYFEGERFGGRDAERAIKAGHSVAEVQAFVDANQGIVHADNRGKGVGSWSISANEGVGGGSVGHVGDVQQGQPQPAAPPAAPQVDWGAKFTEMQQAFTDQMQAYQTQQNTWQQKLQDAQFAQQQKQQAWNLQQAQERQAHEAAMLAEARKVKTDTPTHVQQPASPMAIGPGKVSSPQSASSLGRIAQGTTPVVSGLNIGGRPGMPMPGMPRPGGIKRTSAISASV